MTLENILTVFNVFEFYIPELTLLLLLLLWLLLLIKRIRKMTAKKPNLIDLKNTLNIVSSELAKYRKEVLALETLEKSLIEKLINNLTEGEVT
jgi:hypothetical protein